MARDNVIRACSYCPLMIINLIIHRTSHYMVHTHGITASHLLTKPLVDSYVGHFWRGSGLYSFSPPFVCEQHNSKSHG